jgi:hypothetical protein
MGESAILEASNFYQIKIRPPNHCKDKIRNIKIFEDLKTIENEINL